MTEVPTPAAAPLRANCVEIEPVLTRKEKKNLEAKKKLDKTLKAMTRYFIPHPNVFQNAKMRIFPPLNTYKGLPCIH